MGRRVWLPWVSLVIVGTTVAAVGYPDWVAGIGAIVAFEIADRRRDRSLVAGPPLFRNRREAWCYALGEPFGFGGACLSIAYLVTGWESSLPSGVWLIGNVAIIAFVQLSNVVERRAGGFSSGPWMGRARREAWALVRTAPEPD